MAMDAWITQITDNLGPEGARRAFYLLQIGVGALFALLVLRARSGSKSGFAVRESDLRKPGKASIQKSSELAQARVQPKSPLQLEGIRVQGATPHEILGVKPGASEAEIQKAYRDKMKQYHPDKIGRPGTREWNDAQKIAEAINHAKNELLKRPKPQG